MTLDLPSPPAPLKIGTRGSPLALAQAHETRARLIKAFDLEEDALEIVGIKTTGDMDFDRPLKEIGGKGIFTKEIEDGLADGTLDIAVHSMKDMPTVLPDGLAITALLPREDVRDAFISHAHAGIEALPKGAAPVSHDRSSKSGSVQTVASSDAPIVFVQLAFSTSTVFPTGGSLPSLPIRNL